MVFVYEGVISLLAALDLAVPDLPAMLPSLFTPLLLMLVSMVFFSTLVSNLAVFYLSEDLALLKMSPVSSGAMFSSRLLLSLFYSSWMAIVIGVPALLGLWQYFKTSFIAVLLAFFTGFLLFLSAGALSYIVIALFVRFVPFNRVRSIVKLAGVSLLLLLLAMAQLLQGDAGDGEALQFLEFAGYFENFVSPFNPCYWAAAIAASHITGSGTPVWTYWGALTGMTAGLLFAGYSAFSRWYNQSSDLLTDPPRSGRSAVYKPDLFDKVTGVLPRMLRAIMRKDLRLQLRDPAQILQLLLLCLIIGVYLTHLKMISSISGLDPGLQRWWKAALLVINFMMCSLTLSAVCTRFVYPAVALEGKSFWILQKSPVAIYSLLWWKIACWSIPITLMYSVTLAAGVLIIIPPPGLLPVTLIMTVITPVTLAGLSLAFGALYAEFDWEHVSQLSSSGGSLLTMLFLFVMQLFHGAAYGLLLILSNRFLEGIDRLIISLPAAVIIIAFVTTLSWLLIHAVSRRAHQRLSSDTI